MKEKAPSSTSEFSIPLEKWLAEGSIFSLSSDRLFIGWGEARRSSTIDSSSSHWFYCPDFFLDSPTPWVSFPHHQVISPQQLAYHLQLVSPPPRLPLKWSAPLKKPFQEEFEHIQPLFENHSLTKVVLYTTTHSYERYTPTHLLQSVLNLCNLVETTSAFLYGFWDQTSGTLGATPELLFHVPHANRLKTMALAGTQKSDSCDIPMDQNPKLLAEHEIVVEDICSQLADLGSITKGSLQVITLPRLRHLYTPIVLQMQKQESFEKLVQRLHPTPALGGYPREAAWNRLREYQKKIPRGGFGAPIGYQNTETNEQLCYVGIRNGTWDNQGLSILAGCGIIPESTFEEEWEEALLKINAIKGLLKV